MISHDYTKDLVLEMNYGTTEINDIHQSNNMSNATQERLQETSEEPEMCDSSCQTRESLFDPRISDPGISSPAFSTFGYRSTSGSQNGVGINLRKAPQTQLTRQSTKQSQSNSPGIRQSFEQYSACSPAALARESDAIICARHTPIPAPPGWSSHDPTYTEMPEYLSYQRYHSPKPDREPQNYHPPPGLTRQITVGSGERYGNFLYGSGRGSSNTASNTNSGSTQHSNTPKYPPSDPRYRAEAVIEVDQKRPFSIESTKSAPDVIATH